MAGMSAWYVSRGGQSSGPLSQQQLQQMAQMGQLGADAYVAGPGLSDWTLAAHVPLLAGALAPGGYAPYPQAPSAGAGGMTPAQIQAAFPMGVPAGAAPGQAAQRGEPKSSWVKERLRGLAAIGLALFLLIVNVIMLTTSGYFIPKTLIVGLGALGYGGWVVIFGDEYDDYTLELVQWKQFGMYGCGGAGALLGLLLSILIAE
jgi:hypothetical protein